MKAVCKMRSGLGFECVDADIPQIEPGEVSVHAEATAICGSDLHFCQKLKIFGNDKDGSISPRLNPEFDFNEMSNASHGARIYDHH